MHISNVKHARSKEAGFSIVEMLMAAFILAVGILGLTMLQVMSYRASRGSRNLTTAIQVAERIMDEVEMEGRLSWLDLTNPQGTASTLNRKYIGTCTSIASVTGTYNIDGDPPTAARPTFFTAATLAPQTVAGATGSVTDFRVQVTFTESVGNDGVPITRNVVLTRRVLHG